MTRTILLHYQPAVFELQGYIASTSPHKSTSTLPNRLLDLALEAGSGLNLLDATQHIIRHEIRRILETVNDFNTVLCRLKLLTLLNSPPDIPQENVVTLPKVITILVQELLSSANAQPSSWVSLISNLPQNHALLVCFFPNSFQFTFG